MEERDLQKKFGEHVKFLRLGAGNAKKGVSQEVFAQRCDLSKAYISAIERGIANPKLTHIGSLAKGFDISMSELLLCENFDFPNPDDVRKLLLEMISDVPDENCVHLYHLMVSKFLRQPK